MKIIDKDDLPDFTLPLPLYSAIHIADAIGRDGEEFDVFIGLEKKYAEQLKKLSLDESDTELQEKTGDKNRFGLGSYEDWYKKNRTPFCLIHKRTDALAALIWFGPKPIGAKSSKFGIEKPYEIQDEWHTISFRSYPAFRGKGIMKNFSKFVIEIYKNHFPNAKFWTGTDDRNTAFIKLISDLRFKVDEENSDLESHWLVMTRRW